MLKKLLFLFAYLTVISCSSDDDSASDDTSIDPPAWIQGIWIQEYYLDLNLEFGFEFKSDDFCQITNEFKSCTKAQIDLLKQGPMEVNVYEEISNDRYVLEITQHTSVVEYEFEKISSTRIKKIQLGGDIFYIKQ